MLIRASIAFFVVTLTPLLTCCAPNNALKLMEASKHTELFIPGPDVIEQEFKGRAFCVGRVYLDSGAKAQTPESYPEHSFLRLIRNQVVKGFSNAGLDKRCIPANVVDVAIEEMKFTKGMFLIPDPSILRVRVEVRNIADQVVMKGEIESRELPTIPVVLPGVVGVLPVGFPGQEWAAVSKMIPAVAVAITRTMVGLQLGKELGQIEIYPEDLAAGGIVMPDLFLRGSPYGISELTRADFESARDFE